MSGFLNWLNHFFGMDNLSGPAYGFWSGAGADLGEIAIFGGVIQLYRKHNCHVKGCLRVGKHSIDGTPYVVCAKHHPELKGQKFSHEDLLKHVEQLRGRKANS